MTPNNQNNEADSAKYSGWISCDHRLPEMDEPVFLMDPVYGPMIGSRGWAEDGWLWGSASGVIWHNGKCWDCDCHQDADYQPTHWHPMPAELNLNRAYSNDAK